MRKLSSAFDGLNFKLNQGTDMTICKHCEKDMEWARLEERWIPLIPIGQENEHARTHVDNSGHLRTLHKVVCVEHHSMVQISLLAEPVRLCDMPVKKRRKKK